jgi:hypothetical protein
MNKKVYLRLSRSLLDLNYKALRIRNLQKMGIFRSKIVSFGLDKHTSLCKQRH